MGINLVISLLNLCCPDCWFNLTDRSGWCTMRNWDWQGHSWARKSWGGVMFICYVGKCIKLECVLHISY